MKVLNQREVEAAITQLRGEIQALPQDSGGKRKGVTPDLQRRVTTAFVESDMPLLEFAAAVSISPSSAYSWRKRWAGLEKRGSKHKASAGIPGFKKMTVTEDVSAPRAGFTIEGPNGMRMTGLGADDVARLWKALC
jgi:hypothetical protein